MPRYARLDGSPWSSPTVTHQFKEHECQVRWEKLNSFVFTAAAVVIAGVLVVRQLDLAGGTGPKPKVPEYVKGWEGFVSRGVAMPATSNQVQVVVFSDLECPFCRRFHRTLERVEAHLPGRLNLVFVHFPLPQHRYAKQSAVAAECALRQGKFRQFIDTVFAQQDSLGAKTPIQFALEAGVQDTVAFNRCSVDPVTMSRIAAGIALGDSVKVDGTPTIYLSGWRIPYVPSDTVLRVLVETLLKGEKLLR